MVELQMVRRMIVRSLYVAPVVIAALWWWNGSGYAVSGAAGVAMTLLNLLIAARIIGGVAEHHPRLLLAAALVALTVGLTVLTAVAFALKRWDLVYFPITGFTLVGTHLVLVLWEGAGPGKLERRSTGSRGSRSAPATSERTPVQVQET